MNTSTVLFAGIGLMDCAIYASGGRVVQSVEWEPKIAAQYNYNFPNVRLLVQSVQSIHPEDLTPTTHIHLSPPCTEASIANPLATETEASITAAIASLEIIQSIHQRGGGYWITLENVWGYRQFESFKLLLRGLRSLGYLLNYQKLNASDFGVPQNRERLWLRAALPPFAPIGRQLSLLGTDELLPIVGQAKRISWWEAITHLVPQLPLTRLSQRQLQRLPYLKTLLLGKQRGQVASVHQPSFTITSSVYRDLPLLLKRTGANHRDRPIPYWEPAPTLRALGGRSDQFDLVCNWEVRRLTPDALWLLQMYACSFRYHWKPGIAKGLKCLGIGNGVAFLNAKAVLESLMVF